MKKYYSIALALIGLVFVSCQKVSSDAEKIGNGKNVVKTVISATIADRDVDATKTSLDPATLKLNWTENDKLYVMAADTKDLWDLNRFDIVNSSIKGGTAQFGSTVDMSLGTFFVAFYGKTRTSLQDLTQVGLILAGKDNYGTSSMSYIDFNIPYTQKYSSKGPNPDIFLMRSTKESGNSLDSLVFENINSIMKIPIKDTRTSKATLSSIRVSLENPDYNTGPLSGRFYGNFLKKGDDTPISKFKEYRDWARMDSNKYGKTSIAESGGTFGDVIVLDKINVQLTDDAQNFYIVIWPGKHGKISVTFTDSESNSKKLYFNSFTSTAGKVSAFPEVDLGAL